MSGIRDVIVYCSPETAELGDWALESKWNPATSHATQFTSLEVMHSQSPSYGDAMRMIDSKGIITGDFLVLYSDTVANCDMGSILTKHRQRRIKDKNAIMTVITRASGQKAHRAKPKAVEPVFVVNPRADRILHYDEMTPLDHRHFIDIPDEVFLEPEFEIRSDLIDTGMDICTPEVLALWSESFDADKPRSQFLHNILKDYELNGKTIHIEVLKNKYAARVSNLQYYDAISKDIMSRFVHPFHPETNLPKDHKYTLGANGMFKEDGVILARSCQVGRGSIIGRATIVGEGTIIKKSFIGRNCKIGNNVTLNNAYIWDDITIEDGATLNMCIIGNNAVIKDNATIQEGALISFGVVIGKDITIAPNARITKAKRRLEDDEGELIEVPSEPSVVGKDGEGYLYEEDEEDDKDPCRDLLNKMIYDASHLKITEESCSTIGSDDEDGSDDETIIRSRMSSYAETISDDEQSGDEAAGHNFHKDAVQDVFKTLSEAGDFGNTRVEFTSLRLSNNASDHQMHRAIAVGFNKRIAQLMSESGFNAAKAVKDTLAQEGAKEFISDVAIGREKNAADQSDFLVSVQKDLIHREGGRDILYALCVVLYDDDVLEENGFDAWWANSKSTETEEMAEVRGKAQEFMDWLKETSEEEDSSEEESDEESDEDSD